MRKRRIIPGLLAVALAGLGFGIEAALALSGPPLEPPTTRKSDHVDTHFGTQVADPYRWLEDDNSPETAAWVTAQNKLTFGALEQTPFRAAVKARLEKLQDYPRYTAPFRRGDRFFFYKNDGLQNQNVLYVQTGLDGKPETLIGVLTRFGGRRDRG